KELLRIENANDRFPGGFGTVFGLTYAPDGKTLAGARINQPPCLWDTATGKELRQFGGERRDRHIGSWVTFSPDGQTLAEGGGRVDPSVRLADVNTGIVLQEFGGHKELLAAGVFSPDGTTLATIDDETIRLFEVATGRSRELPLVEGQAAPDRRSL